MIVITTAMSKEHKLIKSHMSNIFDTESSLTGDLAGHSVALLETGIGKVNAAGELTSFLCGCSRNIEAVIAIGCAGAADADLSVGDIVIGNSYCYHDVYCGEPNQNGQIQGMPAVFPSAFSMLTHAERYRLGTIVTGDWFVTTCEKIEAIKNFLPTSYNVCAIDMESAALAQVCYKQDIPFVSIRVISDNPLLPNQKEQYEGFWDDMADRAFDSLIKLL